MFTFKICTRINGLRAANSDSADAKWDWRSAKRPQRRRAWRNGSFRRLLILVFFFGKRDKHSCSASAIINLWMVSIVDSLLSTLHASANRILRCEANAYFIGSGYASSLSFFFSGCRPRFSRLAASPLNACARALPLLNLKKKRDCSQSTPTPKGEPNQFRNSV